MRHLGMIGTTFRRAQQGDLQRYTIPVADSPNPAMEALHRACDFRESVYIATCNRVEVVFIGRPGVSVAEYRRRLYEHFHPDTCSAEEQMRAAARLFHAYEGEGAVERLFSVAASVDSMMPGETQILGQVKHAHHCAQAGGLAGPLLRWLFEEAFAAAKRVRSTTRLGQGTVSLISLAADVVQERLRAGGVDGGKARLVVVGVGAMAEQCGAVFAQRDDVQLCFVNRTVSRAETLAQRFGGRALGLATFLAQPVACDVIITATAAPAPFLDATFFRRLCDADPNLPWVIDLAVQRDCDAAAAAAAGVVLYDLDRLKIVASHAAAERAAAIAQARLVLEEELAAFRRKAVKREMGPLVRSLRERYQSDLEMDLEELFTRVLRHCDPQAQEEIRRWAVGVMNRMAHVPITGLKNLAFEHGTEAVDAFVQGMLRSRERIKKGTV